MKTMKKVSAFLLMVVLCMSVMVMPAFAVSTSQDGLEVTLTTDKETYSQSEQIVATLTVTNTNEVKVSNVSLENVIPEGYKLADGSESTKQVESLDVGETVTLIVTYVADSASGNETDTGNGDSTESGDNSGSETENQPGTDNNSGDSSNTGTGNNSGNNENSNQSNTGKTDSAPATGDNANIVLWGVLLVVAGAGIITILALKKKKGKKLLSLFLCVAMIGTLIPLSTVCAYAATVQRSISISQNISVGSNALTLKALVTYNEISEAEEYIDTDSDGVPDYIEEYFGTDISGDDADNDGLSDYIEIYVTGTDPLKEDSDENGINDGNEDADGDGLSNLEEINAGTDLTKADSDSDGINDADEINKYGTNPTKYDTDGDDLSDGDEILLGLDPLNPYTDGITPDAERLFEQELEDTYVEESLLENNIVIPSIGGTVPGNINKHVSVTEKDIYALDDNRAAVGKAVYVDTDYTEGTDLRLSFSCNEDDDRFGFYMICQYADGEFVPCETTQNGNNIWATVSNGVYFVVDTEKLLIDLDISIEKYRESDLVTFSVAYEDEMSTIPSGPSNTVSDEWCNENYTVVDKNGVPVEQEADDPSSVAETEATEDPADANTGILERPLEDGEHLLLTSSLEQPIPLTTERATDKISGQADIVFVIDTTSSMSGAINNVVANIESFVDALQADHSVKANFALIDYKDITRDEDTILVKNGSSAWYSDVSSFKAKINSLVVTGGGDGPETPIDALAMAQKLDFRQNANKFIILVTDANYKTNNNYGIGSMDEMTAVLKQAGIVTSVISATVYESVYHNLYKNTGGVFGNIYGDFKSVLLQLADNIGEIVNDGSWVLLSDYQFVKLGQPLGDSDYSSDEDSLSDVEELGEKVESDVTPYINWVLKNYNIPEGMYDDPTTVKVYKYNSNPILSDTDFDGKNNDEDSVCQDNWFAGTLTTDYASSDVFFCMDYRWFLKSNAVYNDDLSTLSLLYASAVYGNQLRLRDSLSEDVTNGESIEDVMSYFGLKKAKTISITASDNHLSEVALGYRTVEYGGIKKTVLAVIVRGTNGTIAEWSSNFDVGDSLTFSSTSDWKTIKNHKGFDVAANRIMAIVNEYIAENKESDDFCSANLCYWVAGHSRGAAIANIIGAYLEGDGKEAFTYTFATPNTTLADNANTYSSIFNIVNSDDFVPCLPMEDWGYTRYGKTASSSIASNYETVWENLTGIWDYNPDTFGMQNTVSALASIITGDPEVDCYAYTCKDHGDGSSDNITITNYGTSRDSREEAIAKIPDNALPYCKITRYEGWLFVGWNFDVCQTPAYFMQILAAKMAGSIGNYRFVVELNIADRYESAKTAIIRSAIGGLEHPHFTESYYVLAKNMKGSQFK